MKSTKIIVITSAFLLMNACSEKETETKVTHQEIQTKKSNSALSTTIPVVEEKNIEKEHLTLDEQLLLVKELYGAITYTKSFYKETYIPSDNAPGGANIYTLNGELKLYSEAYGDGGPSVSNEYYFDNGELIFCFKTKNDICGLSEKGEYIYDQSEERFYYHEGELVQWKSSEFGVMNVNSNEFKQMGNSVFAEGETFATRYNNSIEASLSLEDKLIEVKEHYGAVNYSANFYQKVESRWDATDCGECPPTGTLTGFFNGDEVKKIVYKPAGSTQEFYFWNNKLSFVFTTYNTNKHDRYYYDENGNMMKWINSNGGVVTDEEALIQQSSFVTRNSQNFKRVIQG